MRDRDRRLEQIKQSAPETPDPRLIAFFEALPDDLLDWFGDEFDQLGGVAADPDEVRALMVVTDAKRRRR